MDRSTFTPLRSSWPCREKDSCHGILPCHSFIAETLAVLGKPALPPSCFVCRGSDARRVGLAHLWQLQRRQHTQTHTHTHIPFAETLAKPACLLLLSLPGGVWECGGGGQRERGRKEKGREGKGERWCRRQITWAGICLQTEQHSAPWCGTSAEELPIQGRRPLQELGGRWTFFRNFSPFRRVYPTFSEQMVITAERKNIQLNGHSSRTSLSYMN